MRSSERRQLKQDQFAVATQETLDWASEHRNLLTYGIAAAVVVIGLFAGGFYFQQNREQKASFLLSEALVTYRAPLRPAGSQEIPGEESFTSAMDRAKAAGPKFTEVTQNYSHTDAATMANYFLGLVSEDLGDNAKAEAYLKDVASSGNKDIAALAKSALGSLYHETGRDQDAINIYKGLADKPTNTISKATAQISLAEIYATKDPGAARKLYEEVVKENASNEVGNLATMRLQALGK